MSALHWKISLSGEHGDSDISIVSQSPNGNPVWIGRVYGEGPLVTRRQETIRKAKLFAAAPDLAQELKFCLDNLELIALPMAEELGKFISIESAISRARSALEIAGYIQEDE